MKASENTGYISATLLFTNAVKKGKEYEYLLQNPGARYGESI